MATKLLNTKATSQKLAALMIIFNAGYAFAADTITIKSPLGESSANITSGSTINLSTQTGSKSNLTFGTNTSFGASLSTQFSEGMTVTASSRFNPTTAVIKSEIGVGETLGKTTANISNLSAGGGEGTGETTIGGTTITANRAALASGNAILEGLSSGIDIVLDPSKSGFQVEAMPNVIGDACSIGTSDACQYTFKSGEKVVEGKDFIGTKPYDGQQFSSGNATASVNTNTTVDIGSSQFSSVFAQSF